MASLPGIDLSASHSNTNPTLEFTYQVKCRDCNYRFPARVLQIEMNDPSLNEVMKFACRHADRYQHTVEYCIIAPPCESLNMEGSVEITEFEPRKRTWRDRLNEWVVCIGLPILIVVGVFAFLGKLSWLTIGGAVIGALIGDKLYQLWQRRKGVPNQE